MSRHYSSGGSRQRRVSPFIVRCEIYEVAPSGLFEIVERPDLPSHLKGVAIDRIVPALDVDGA
jgi:hypothetical protein